MKNISEILKHIDLIKDGNKDSNSILELEELIFNGYEDNDPISELLNDFSYKIGFYESNKNVRDEHQAYYGDNELNSLIAELLQNLKKYNIDSK